jgi:MFS transporter, FSR family, fosmidomycin resistance protein
MRAERALPCSTAMGARPALRPASLVIAVAFSYLAIAPSLRSLDRLVSPKKTTAPAIDMPIPLNPSTRVNAVIGTGHFLSHYYQLCLPPMFLAWQTAFGVSFAELGLSMALMSCATGLLQTPVGFLVDRYGARRFLVGGTLLMTLSIAALGFATAYWQVLLLCLLSGTGNSVIHPTDYAILSGSVERSRMGRSFAMHTFSGNLGSMLAPPVTAGLMIAAGWRGTLLLVGLLGIPLVLVILWQSAILRDQVRRHEIPRASAPSGRRLLMTPPMLLFFGFFLLSAVATGGIQSWLIPVLQEVHGVSLSAASLALTSFLTGATGGVLLGGWFADRSDRHLAFSVLLTLVAAALLLVVAFKTMPAAATLGVLFAAGMLVGASRTPRDMMLKDASPPGQIGKVFGFVSAGLPLGGALAPVPFGYLIDKGRADLVLVLVALVLLASLLCVGTARAAAGRDVLPAPAE